MDILWILLPSPIVGYLLADSVRRIFSDDDKLLRTLVANQPVTGLAALTALGSIVVWAVAEALRGLL